MDLSDTSNNNDNVFIDLENYTDLDFIQNESNNDSGGAYIDVDDALNCGFIMDESNQSVEENEKIEVVIDDGGLENDNYEYENENDEDAINETLSRSQLLAKLSIQHKQILKKERKIQKLKHHLREYRRLLEEQANTMDNMYNELESYGNI